MSARKAIDCKGTGFRTCDDSAPVQMFAGDLRAILRRDWAVRVLDAWAEENPRQRYVALGGGYYFDPDSGHGPDVADVSLVHGQYVQRRLGGDDLPAARLAAAEAVWPELPESVRAELGARP